MKKFIIIFFGIITALRSFALEPHLNNRGVINQWVIVGVRGSFNSTWLLNQNQLNDKGIKYKASWGYSGGLMLGAHYSSWGAVCIEGLYSTISQKITSNIDSIKWNNRTDLAYYEFPILLHFVHKEFKYIEAGIKISSLSGAKYTYESPAILISPPNVKNNFEKSNISIVFGWGSSLWGDGGGLLDLGIRLTYGLSDIISSSGGKGKDYQSNDGSTTALNPYTLTNTATIGFHLTYNFDLGWWLHDECRRKYKFFLFNH